MDDTKKITIKLITDSLQAISSLSDNVANGTESLAKDISCFSPVNEVGEGMGEPQNYLQAMNNSIENIKCNLEDTRNAGRRISQTFEISDPYDADMKKSLDREGEGEG